MKSSPLEFLIPRHIESEQKSRTSAHISLSPLERGFGHTIGNALRRVLLSYMPGYAITRVQFDKVPHEYLTNKNIEEDMVDVLLNLKQVAVKLPKEKERAELSLRVKSGKKERVVTAADIETGSNAEIINPEHVIVHLVKDSEISAVLHVEHGRGYRSADQRLGDGDMKAIGALDIDASFSPVRRVAYRVDSARLGNRTDLDRLLLDLETDGTISPEEAIRRAATILWQHFQPLIEEGAGDGRAEIIDADRSIVPALMERIETLSDKGVSMRVINALKKENLALVGDLVRLQKQDLLRMPNIGKTALDEIEESLRSVDLNLGKIVPNWPTRSGTALGDQ